VPRRRNVASLCPRRERQLEGIAKAKAAGVYKSRPPSIEASQVRELKAQGMRPVDIAKALKIGRASVYRVLGQSVMGVACMSRLPVLRPSLQGAIKPIFDLFGVRPLA
jgi:hypothetical protein